MALISQVAPPGLMNLSISPQTLGRAVCLTAAIHIALLEQSQIEQQWRM